MQFQIRASERRDIPAVDALMGLSYPKLLGADYPPSLMVMAIPLISRAQPNLMTSGTYYVAEREDRMILGAGGWSMASPTGPRISGAGNIRHFATHPDATRQGVAGAILEHCKTQARAAGCDRLDCFSTRNATSFYEAFGFEIVKEVVIQLRDGIDFPAIEMRCVL